MEPLRILIADDSATIRSKVSRTLADAGYLVDSAADGHEALRLMRGQPPFLAILDIEMPGLGGYGVCEEMKKLGEPWDRIPIIFFTMTRSHALEVLGETLGAYLPKPASDDVLLRTVEKFRSKSWLPARGTVSAQ